MPSALQVASDRPVSRAWARNSQGAVKANRNSMGSVMPTSAEVSARVSSNPPCGSRCMRWRCSQMAKQAPGRPNMMMG